LLVVAADGAEHDLEPLLGQLRIRRRAGNHRDAGLVVHGGSRNRHAGVEVTDNAGDLGIDELLRDGRAHLRVSLVVFAHHLELDRLAADLDLLRGGFVDGEVDAVLVVLAEVGDAARQRAGVADLDDDDFFSGSRGRLGRFGLLGFFLTATIDGHERGRDERQAELAVHVHSSPPGEKGMPGESAKGNR
jgi:hypothetical protein